MYLTSRSLAACRVLDLSLVVPVYNEAETVRLFADRVREIFDAEPAVRLELVFVNDGSSDRTLEELLECQGRDSRVRIVDLSRNFGKEAALTAGLQVAKGRVVVPIDVDLQDPPELILEMIGKWREGYDVVLGRRINRDTDSWAKRVSATSFYRIHNWIAEPIIPENVGDFRLMDRAVVDALRELPESRRFMKGLFAWVGFRTAFVDYARPERSAGSTKFNGWRLWNFALEGLTSFSTDPLRIWTYIGGAVALASLFLKDGTFTAGVPQHRVEIIGDELAYGFPSVVRVPSTQGYNPLLLRAYSEAFPSTQAAPPKRFSADGESYLDDSYRRIGLRFVVMPHYITTENRDRFGEHGEVFVSIRRSLEAGGARMVKAGDAYEVWELPRPDPKVVLYVAETSPSNLLDSDRMRSDQYVCAVVRYRNTAIDVQCETQAAALVVLSEVVARGWAACVNGEPAEILTAGGLLRSVRIPAGRSQVSLRYQAVPFLRSGSGVCGQDTGMGVGREIPDSSNSATTRLQ